MNEKLEVRRCYQCGGKSHFPNFQKLFHSRPAGVRFHLSHPRLRDVVSWRCSLELKKGWKTFHQWFIIYSVTVTQRYPRTLVYLLFFSRRSIVVVGCCRKKFFLWNLISFFDYFLPPELNEDLVRNVLIYGSRKSRCCYICCFSMNHAWNKSWIYYLRLWWCMSFNLHFLSGKRDAREEKVAKFPLPPKLPVSSFSLLPPSDKTKVNKSPFWWFNGA